MTQDNLSEADIRLVRIHAPYMLGYGAQFRTDLNKLLNAARSSSTPSAETVSGGDLVMVPRELIEQAISGLRAYTGDATQITQADLSRYLLAAAPSPPSVSEEDLAHLIYANVTAEILTSYAPDGDPKPYTRLRNVHAAAHAIIAALGGKA